MPKLSLSVLEDTFAVCRLEAGSQIPKWATHGSVFFSITKTKDELSVVCAQANVPQEVKAERDWKALKIEGSLDFALTGILASLATPLAEAGISIFAISTYDTDYILVKSDQLKQAVEVLGKRHTVKS